MEVVVYNMEILKHFGLKKSDKKNWQNLQRLTDWFNISQYIYIYIYINTYIYYIHYTLYIYILFTKGIDTFSPGRSEIFWAQNIRQQKLIKVFELYQFFQWQNVSIIPYCILLTRIKSISQ